MSKLKFDPKERLAIKAIVSCEAIAGMLDGIVWEGQQSLSEKELGNLKQAVGEVIGTLYTELIKKFILEYPHLKPDRLK